MGLDWMLEQRKAREGEHRTFAELLAHLKELREGFDEDEASPKAKREHEAKEAALVSKLENVSISAMEVIGAPRIGIDQEATEWFRKEHYEQHRKNIVERKEATDSPYYQHWMRPFEAVLKDNHGKYVPALAKDKGGLAKITGMVAGDCDFRGKCIGRSDVLMEVDPGLCERAYEDQDGDECVDYADSLEQAVDRYKEKHKKWESDENAKDDIEAVLAGVEWLKFWGSRGFGYHAWY